MLMTLVRRISDQSRADLARASGMAGFSASRIVDGLIARNLLSESAPVPRGRGKPSSRLALQGDAAFAAGISLMTDAVSVALVNLSGAIMASADFPLENPALRPTAVHLRRHLDRLMLEAGLDRAQFVGAGVAITGFFIGDGHKLNPPGALDDWAVRDLVPELSGALDCGIWIDNDGNAAALGEAGLGQGRTSSSFAYLYFAAGFGGGVISEGKLMRGRHGNAGEFGACIPPGMPVPSLERLRVLMNQHGVRDLGLAEALGLCGKDVPGVAEWLDEATESLSIVISSIAGTLDPDAIVFGGRLPGQLADVLLPRLAFNNPLRRGYSRPTPLLLKSAVISDATAAGAATLPLTAAFFQ
ncbi:ROK family protein [Blastomonas aquatica]|uniref:Sugar kinase n=1 Tax=Blastomonas aquatica TaxID=1510276 RepID=A0ABQ1JLD3_9SPHN|nr:ROK family protein [Blastomonas aquatica]GGB71904.1 sugar kinase [Blastomonas aquatica]